MLYVPELSHSLFSVSKATKKGITVTILNVLYWIKEEEIVAKGVKKGSLYYLECKSTPYSVKVNVVETNNLWHQRYGHLSSKYLQLIAKKKLVNGLKSYDCSEDIDLCESCISGKQH